MTSGFALPTEGPWKVRLSSDPNQPGIYSVELMDPKAGGVQSGPFFLMFPTTESAFDWLSAFASIDHSERSSRLERGGSVEGIALSAIWGPMISAMYHGAGVRQRLASPWWYGSFPNWAEIDPLLPPMTQAASQILIDAESVPGLPRQIVMDAGFATIEGHEPAIPLPFWRVETIEYPDQDFVANSIVILYMIGSDPAYFHVSGTGIQADRETGGFTFISDNSGLVELRSPNREDSSLVSAWPIELPISVLQMLMEAKGHSQKQPFDDLPTGPVPEESILVTTDDDDCVIVIQYEITIGSTAFLASWFESGSWNEGDWPKSQPQWRRATQGMDDDSISEMFHEAGQIYIEPHAIKVLLERYEADKPIDRLMVKLAGESAESEISVSELTRDGYFEFGTVVDDSPFVYAEADPGMRDILAFQTGKSFSASYVLSLYAYLISGNEHYS